MVALSLKICVRQCNVVKTMQFEPCTPVYDACRIIRERVPEAQTGQGWWTTQKTEFPWWKSGDYTFACCVPLCVSASDYGLFLSDDDPRKGIWLESGRTLDYYMLRNGVRLSQILRYGDLSTSLIISLKWFIFWWLWVRAVILFPVLLLFISQDILEYKKKQRPQKIKMLDGAVKTIMVDDSKTVGELLVTICSRIGIQLLSKTGNIHPLFYIQFRATWLNSHLNSSIC